MIPGLTYHAKNKDERIETCEQHLPRVPRDGKTIRFIAA